MGEASHGTSLYGIASASTPNFAAQFHDGYGVLIWWGKQVKFQGHFICIVGEAAKVTTKVSTTKTKHGERCSLDRSRVKS